MLRRAIVVTLLLVSRFPLPAPGQQRAPDPRSMVTVGTARASRGQIAKGVIEVPPGVDSGSSIPVFVINGAKPGPMLALLAGSHGTEYASIVALGKLAARLNPAEISGTVVIVPLMNPSAFGRIVPHLNPVDGKNMNRFFPGNPQGTQTDRASYLITKQVVEPSDHLIDYHGGDLDEDLRQYSYWSRTGRAAQDSVSRGMVLAFGLDHIVISSDRPTDPNASRFLENTATTRGKPSITVEAGRAGTVLAEDVEAMVNGSLNVMAYLRMIDRPFRPVATPVWIERLANVISEQSGIFYPLVGRGMYVSQGMRIGYVTDFHGATIYEAIAPASGVVMYIRAIPTLNRGETTASIGVVGVAPR